MECKSDSLDAAMLQLNKRSLPVRPCWLSACPNTKDFGFISAEIADNPVHLTTLAGDVVHRDDRGDAAGMHREVAPAKRQTLVGVCVPSSIAAFHLIVQSSRAVYVDDRPWCYHRQDSTMHECLVLPPDMPKHQSS